MCLFTCSPDPLPSEPQVLTKMKQQAYEPSSWPEAEEVTGEGSGCWKDELQKELSDIW